MNGKDTIKTGNKIETRKLERANNTSTKTKTRKRDKTMKKATKKATETTATTATEIIKTAIYDKAKLDKDGNIEKLPDQNKCLALALAMTDDSKALGNAIRDDATAYNLFTAPYRTIIDGMAGIKPDFGSGYIPKDAKLDAMAKALKAQGFTDEMIIAIMNGQKIG